MTKLVIHADSGTIEELSGWFVGWLVDGRPNCTQNRHDAAKLRAEEAAPVRRCLVAQGYRVTVEPSI